MSDLFRIVKFERSHLPQKKYNAIIEDVKTRKRMRVPFGSTVHEQYRDDVPLKLYKRLDHNDEKRRKNYLARHEKTRHKKFSPSWLSAVFLWGAPRK